MSNSLFVSEGKKSNFKRESSSLSQVTNSFFLYTPGSCKLRVIRVQVDFYLPNVILEHVVPKMLLCKLVLIQQMSFP